MEKFGYRTGMFPKAESVSDRNVFLPFYENFTDKQARGILRVVKENV